jgi:hypothetical protein
MDRFEVQLASVTMKDSYTGTNMAEGNIPQWIGNSYEANAGIGMSHTKTTDFSIVYLSSMSVTVN